MEQTNVRKLKKRTQDDHLRINDISDYNIIENIFSYLPIKQAVQTSIVSTRFKNSWSLSRFLDFEQNFAKGRHRNGYVSIIDRIIKLHVGHKVDRLRIFLKERCDAPTVEGWINFAVMKGVEELDLGVWISVPDLTIPSSLFECTTVRILKLSLCHCPVPPNFSGLTSLTALHLRMVILKVESIEEILSNSPLLECLELRSCTLPSIIKISRRVVPRLRTLSIVQCDSFYVVSLEAPNLTSFTFAGYFPEFKFICGVSKLNTVMVKFTEFNLCDHYKVKKFLFDLAHVSVLTIHSTYIELLAPIVAGEKIIQKKIHFSNLKEYQLVMERDTFINPLDIALFLSNCPCLERVFIDLEYFNFWFGLYWELHGRQAFDKFNCSFRCLKAVRLKGFKAHKHEMLLVKLFLEKAKVLETMLLVTPSRKLNICAVDVEEDEQIRHVSRASPIAKIFVCHKNGRDESILQPVHSEVWGR